MTKEDLKTTLEEAFTQPNLSDFAFFMAVMKVKEAHRDILSIILDEKELELVEVKVEQVVLNKKGKRAIRVDALAMDKKKRRINTEMQNDSEKDDVRKRARYYQSLMDTPVLKAGKETKYKYLPETIIIFITQEDIFGKDLARYTFTEQCEEVHGLHLKDGTQKIFLNMTSKNGKPELISLLQYMKETSLDNPEIIVKDERLAELDRIVQEVKETEEWEDVSMSIYSKGIEKGIREGIEKGIKKGFADGLQKGKQEGMEEKTKTIIKNMLRRNMPDADICALAECGQELVDKVRGEWNGN